MLLLHHVSVFLCCVGVAYSGQHVEQIDLAATLAILFAVPIPINSLGMLIPEALRGLSVAELLKAAYVNALQMLRVARTGLTNLAQSTDISRQTYIRNNGMLDVILMSTIAVTVTVSFLNCFLALQVIACFLISK